MKTRIVFTIILLILYFGIGRAYNLIYSPVTGKATAAQFDDSTSSYVIAKAIREGNVQTGMFWLLLAALVITWASPVYKALTKATPIIILFAALTLVSCGPPKVFDYVEVKPNETVWAIPLDALSKDAQVKFNSVGYLDQRKIATKRIMIDKVKRQTGYMWFSYEWLPAARVITIDRSLVTREWTDDLTTGTNRKQEGVGVVTKDSVKLRVGLTVTASIDEDDASTYLYYHGARTLETVLDQNVHSFAVAELTKEYSKLSLSDAQTQGPEIYQQLFTDAKEAFKAKGVTIQYLGNEEGLTYGDPKVQDSINRRYITEQDVSTATQEQAAQRTRNATLILNAQAQADAARKLFEVREASNFQNELEVRLLGAKAKMKMADKWNGNLPANVLPSNSPMLMQFGVSEDGKQK